MKDFLDKNRILLGALALTLIAGLVVIAQRWGVEAENKTYDVVLDYSELELLAEQSEHDIAWWLEQFRDMGITRVGLTEESLSSLMEKSPMAVTATMMDEIMQDANWRSNYPERFVRQMEERGYDRFDVLVEVAGQGAIDFVTEAIGARFPAGSFLLDIDNGLSSQYRYEPVLRAYILLDGSVNDTLYEATYSYRDTKGKGFAERNDIASSKLMAISLGLMPEKVELIQGLGMEIIPRTMSYNGHNDTRYAQAVVAGYEKHGIVPEYIIAGGEAVIGYDDGEFALDYIRDNHITVGLIETNVQRENIIQSGIEKVARGTDLNTVRVFSVWNYIQFRYGFYGYEGAEEIENTLFRTIVERNIRVIYFKPIKQTSNSYAYITDIGVYRDMFDGLNARLARHGISMGRASVMENYQPARLLLLALGLGAGICGALLPGTFLPMRRKWTLALAGAAAVCVAGAWVVMPNTFRLLSSFASAVVFACLAAAFFLQAAKRAGQTIPARSSLRRILPVSAGVLVIAVLLSLAGAIMTAAPLSSTDFMLELGIFRGVKAAQLLPLAFFCLLYVSYYGVFEKSRTSNTLQIRDIVSALRWTIPVWALVLAGLAGLVGYYYLARTGNEADVPISTLELLARNVLEEIFLARPRTKEFLVAFPAIMLSVYCAVRRMPFWTAVFGLAGTIGLTSVCNTFMHIRTPLYLGFIRTGLSLVFGILLGCVYMLCFDLLCRLGRLLRKKYVEAE